MQWKYSIIVATALILFLNKYIDVNYILLDPERA